MDSKFAVGDRVVVVDTGMYPTLLRIGMEGVVVDFTGHNYGVSFDESRPYFHACKNKAKQNHGFYVLESWIRLVADNVYDVQVSAADLSVLF